MAILDNNLNVLVFGETQAGKSSIIKLAAGQPLVDISAGSVGTRGGMMEATSYDVVFPDSQGVDHHIRFFETVGLNEPSLSKNDYFTAIEKANELITQLQRTDGIHLLIFCIRGEITSFTQSNYYLFCDMLCQNKVPVAFVITGMESEYPMENWWIRNAALFKQSNLFCTSHACVTATCGLNNEYAHQYQESQDVIRNMLLTNLSTTPWKPERTSRLISLARGLLKWIGKIGGRGRYLPEEPGPLTVGELAKKLESKCNIPREEAVELAGKIIAKRMENT